MRQLKKTLAFLPLLSFSFQQIAFASPMMETFVSPKDEGEEKRPHPRQVPALSFRDPLIIPAIPHGTDLQAGLQRLKQKILEDTLAEEDIYSQARELLEAHQLSLAHIPSFLEEYVEQLLPPENVLRFREKDLLADEKLHPKDDKFRALEILRGKIRKLPTLAPSLPSSVVGVLKKAEKAYEDFITRFCKAPSLAERKQLLEERSILMGEGIGQYLIPAPLARHLLSKDLCGYSKKREQEGGQSSVPHTQSVHFKVAESSINGIHPPMEWTAHAFSVLFLGPGYTPPSATLILQNVPFFTLNSTYTGKKEGKKAQKLFSEKVIYPEKPISIDDFFAEYPSYHKYFSLTKGGGVVQASESSGELSLYEFFEKTRKNEASFSDLDRPSHSGMFVLSLPAHFTDLKDDNLRLQKKKPISIDNDRLFGNEVVNTLQGHLIEDKNVLALMPSFMKEKVDFSIKAKVQSLDADLLLLALSWIYDQQNQRYKSLYERGLPEGSQRWFIQFKSGRILRLRNELEKLQTIFKEEPLYHRGLHHKFSPVMAAYYETLRDIYKDNSHEAQDALWTKAPFAETLIKDPSLLKDLASFTAIPGEYEENRDQRPQQEAQALLETIDLKKSSSDRRLGVLAIAHDWLSWPTSWDDKDLLFLLAQDLLKLNLKVRGDLKREDLLRTVLSRPAFNPQSTDQEGNILLHLWAQSSLGFEEEILKNWQEKGGDLSALNNKQEKRSSPFDCALENNHETLLIALLKQKEKFSYYEESLEKYYHLAKKGKGWKDSLVRNLFKEQKKTDPYFAWTLKRTKFLSPNGPGEKVEILTYNPHKGDVILTQKGDSQKEQFSPSPLFSNNNNTSEEVKRPLPQREGPTKEDIIRLRKEERFLVPHLKNQLWDEKGNFKAIHTNGSRMVGRAILKEEEILKSPPLLNQPKNHNRLYVKFFPSFAGMAMAISLFQEEFFEDGFLPLTFGKIKEEPVLISPGIGSLQWSTVEKKWEEIDNLHYVLQKTPERLKELDSVATAKSILVAQHTNPEDGKPSNYVLEQLSTGKSRLMEVDAEQAFVPAVAKPPQETGGLLVQMKSVLFCLDQNGEPIPDEVVKLIQNWDIFPKAERWVQRLEVLHNNMQDMFKEKIETLFSQKESYIGIPFQKGEIGDLVGKLIKLQRFVDETPQDTKQEVQ